MGDSVRIWIAGHRETTEPYWDNELYCPIQQGSGQTFLNVRDNTGDNIAEWNPVYAEQTGQYWIWKNADLTDYVGFTQYRRRFEFKDAEEVLDVFKQGYEAIACVPLNFQVVRQYAACHSIDDLKLAWEIVVDLFPWFMDAFKRYIMDGTRLYYSNGFVLKKQDFCDWCEFYQTFAKEFCKRRGWTDVAAARAYIKSDIDAGKRIMSRGVDYQTEVIGFLSERFFTAWLQGRFSKIYHKEYKKYEVLL